MWSCDCKKKEKNYHISFIIIYYIVITIILVHHEEGASEDLSGVQEVVDVGSGVVLATVAAAAVQDRGEVYCIPA